MIAIATDKISEKYFRLIPVGDTSGICCKAAINKKNAFEYRRKDSNKKSGKKLKALYFVVETMLEQNFVGWGCLLMMMTLVAVGGSSGELDPEYKELKRGAPVAAVPDPAMVE